MDVATTFGVVAGILGSIWACGDLFNKCGRFASRAGRHRRACIFFWISGYIGFERHARVNVVYERYLMRRASVDQVEQSIHKNAIPHTGHGEWLLKQIGKQNDTISTRDT